MYVRVRTRCTRVRNITSTSITRLFSLVARNNFGGHLTFTPTFRA